MTREILKEMRSRGAFHCVVGIQVNSDEIMAVGSDVLYFCTDKDYVEWCDLQQVIHGDEHEITVYAIHRI